MFQLDKIKIAIIGVGNCASSLIQGIHYYKDKKSEDAIGLMHWEIGGYEPKDIEVVAAFDVDQRKVGKDVSKAIFAKPNCTQVFCSDVPESGVKVSMGHVLDGVAPHMKDYDDDYTFIMAEEEPSDVVKGLKRKWCRNITELLACRFRRSHQILCPMCTGFRSGFY